MAYFNHNICYTDSVFTIISSKPGLDYKTIHKCYSIGL